MQQHAVTPAGRILLDAEAIGRTLSRIAHEIIERNDELETVALAGIHTRGVPLSQRLRRLIADRAGLDLELGQLDITFHRDDVHVRDGQAPRRRQPVVRDTKLDFELEGRTVILVDDVRVDDSKNMFTTSRPRNVGSFLLSRSWESAKECAVAIRRSTSSRVRSATESRWRRPLG